MKKKGQGWKMPLMLIVGIAIMIGMVRHFHIKNFHCVVPGVLYTSGQPRGMDYTRLMYKYHITTFVNVRQSDEHRERNWYNEERIWMSENGAHYLELPISRKDRKRQFPDKKTQYEFLELMKNKEKLPVLLHGSSGKKRVSMLAATWLIKSQNYSVEKTVKIVEKIREKSLTKAEKQFIQELAE